MPNYIVATIHPWNIEAFNLYSKKLAGNWHLITNKDELTFEFINDLNPEYIFFPHWSWIVPNEIINHWPCVCFHMTDVPFGRGGSPLQNLIIRGIYKTKVSALQMTKQLDAGPVYLKHSIELNGSAEDIFKQLSLIISNMITEIVTTVPTPIEQSGDIVYFERRTPEQSEIPNNLSAEKLYDFIRMLDAPNYPKAFIKQGDNKLEFSGATLENGSLTAKVTITPDSAKIISESHSQQNEKG
jgi:methionyl-tRNA formyltransferase